MRISTEKLKTLVDKKLSMVELLKKHNPHGNYQVGQPCFCPFHDNTRTPAGSLYSNEGEETLWCFSEQKLYKPSDVIETLMEKDIYTVGERLWETLTYEEQEEFLSREKTLEDSFSVTTEEETKDIDKYKRAFKQGKISVGDLLDKYIG